MDTIQNILAFSVLAVSIVFLVRKFFIFNKKPNKNCGGDCACH